MEYSVKTEDTALAQGSGDLPVLSTPRLIALMEGAAVKALRGGLAPGETSVGTRIEVRHLAATPVGVKVYVRARVTGIDDRKLSFEVRADDGVVIIGKGTHQRYVVRAASFLKRTRERYAAEKLK